MARRRDRGHSRNRQHNRVPRHKGETRKTSRGKQLKRRLLEEGLDQYGMQTNATMVD